MDRSSQETRYSKLKKSVINKIFPPNCTTNGRYCLEQIKDIFRNFINSNRSMSKVKSLQCIFQLLEDRCLLSERNLSPLAYLGTFLDIPGIIESVDVYKRLFLSDEAYCKCLCGIECDFQEYVGSFGSNEENHLDLNNNNEVDELGIAIDNISVRIGKLWCVLIRELNVKEKFIEDIRNKYSLENQPREALLFWRRSTGTNATIETLDEALEARCCKLKGLGIHLREPVFSV